MTTMGSNVDLPTALEIDFDLKRRSQELDEALNILKHCLEIMAAARDKWERKKAAEYECAKSETDKITERKTFSESRSLDEKYEAEIAEGVVEHARLEVRSRLAQLSAAQTRASMLKSQLNFDKSSPS